MVAILHVAWRRAEDAPKRQRGNRAKRLASLRGIWRFVFLFGLIIAILVVFLVEGRVMDTLAIILIFVPLFAPAVAAQGFDIVGFRIIVVVVVEIALVTPRSG